jgi:hypothetical protein
LTLRKGFELVRPRTTDITQQITEFERRYGIELPPAFRLFAETFELGDLALLERKFFNPHYQDERWVSTTAVEGFGEVQVVSLNTLEQSLQGAQTIEQTGGPVSYLAFASAIVGAVCVVLRGPDRDRILHYDPNGEPEFTPLADNVFAFVSLLCEQPEEELDSVSFVDIFEHWGDPLLRVRLDDNHEGPQRRTASSIAGPTSDAGKTGFELLEARGSADVVDFDAIERRLGLELPPEFRLFAETFALGRELRLQTYLHPSFSDERALGYVTVDGHSDIEFVGFNTVDNAVLFSQDIEHVDEIEYLTVGYSVIGGIAVGLRGDKRDVVFVYDPRKPQLYIELCRGIFGFVRTLREVIEPDGHGVQLEDLVRPWNGRRWSLRQ